MAKIILDMIDDFRGFVNSTPYVVKILLLTYSSLALASYVMILLHVPEMIGGGSVFGVLLMVTFRLIVRDKKPVR